MKEVKESLLIIKTTEWQIRVKQFKSFRFTKSMKIQEGNFAGVKLSQA